MCPPVPAVAVDADWLFDLRPSDKIADEEVKHADREASEEDEEDEERASGSSGRAAFRNCLPPLVQPAAAGTQSEDVESDF